MSLKQPHEVLNPNLLDPALLDGLETPIPDFYVSYPHPLEAGVECHIPCRELDPGESVVFQMATKDKYPEMPEAKLADLSKAERKEFYKNQKVIDGLDNELFTDVAMCVFLQEGWTRERVEKLPKSTRRAAWEGATVGMNAIQPVVDTFSEESSEGVPDDTTDMPRGNADESERGTDTDRKPVPERQEPPSDKKDK